MKKNLVFSAVMFLFSAFAPLETYAQTNIAPKMVWIKPGNFVWVPGPWPEEVELRGFWMGQYEVTQGEYQAVMGKNPSYFTGDPNRPVEQVNLNDATNYCFALTEQEKKAGRLPFPYAYRLPSEWEWEYAYMAGQNTWSAYYDGGELYSGMANFDGHYEYPPCGKESLFCFNPGGEFLGATTAVGSYPPNAWGLYDMRGNVWEWTTQGPDYPLHGGSWTSKALDCTWDSSQNLCSFPSCVRSNEAGFRVVLAWDFSLWANEMFGNLDSPKEPLPGITSPEAEPISGSDRMFVLSLFKMPHEMNTPAQVNLWDEGFTLNRANPPVWLAFASETNKNNLYFESEFLRGARGLLTVYWGTNLVGSIYQSAVQPGLRSYQFSVPVTERASDNILGFRLDSFSNLHSSVMVTNVLLGYKVADESSRLKCSIFQGKLVITVSGPVGYYQLQMSKDFKKWDDYYHILHIDLDGGNAWYSQYFPMGPDVLFFRTIRLR